MPRRADIRLAAKRLPVALKTGPSLLSKSPAIEIVASREHDRPAAAQHQRPPETRTQRYLEKVKLNPVHNEQSSQTLRHIKFRAVPSAGPLLDIRTAITVLVTKKMLPGNPSNGRCRKIFSDLNEALFRQLGAIHLRKASQARMTARRIASTLVESSM